MKRLEQVIHVVESDEQRANAHESGQQRVPAHDTVHRTTHDDEGAWSDDSFTSFEDPFIVCEQNLTRHHQDTQTQSKTRHQDAPPETTPVHPASATYSDARYRELDLQIALERELLGMERNLMERERELIKSSTFGTSAREEE